ncbi:MAG: DUF3775 domain-containing protein [Sphingomonadaceae bacterium]|nr:DUF3775 domain-containing protein [Sphingomonadaceae bacterium]
MEDYEFEISLDSLCRILTRLREYEAQEPAADPESGSNPTDDSSVDVLDDETNESVEEELRSIIEDLNDDEQRELVALVLVGRGTFDASEWRDALDSADEEAGEDIATWLMDQPLGAGLLDTGMAAFDLNCDDVGQKG